MASQCSIGTVPPLADSLATFWRPGPELTQFQARIARFDPPYPVLERLGDPSFLPGARRWLTAAHDAVAATAVAVAFNLVEEDSDAAA